LTKLGLNSQCDFPSAHGGGAEPVSPFRVAAVELYTKLLMLKADPKSHVRRDGFTYRQIAWEGEAAIYEQKWGGCSEPSVCYEVIRIRRRDGFQIGGRFVGAAEVYPNSEAWGVDGFTLTDKDAAFGKLRHLRSVR